MISGLISGLNLVRRVPVMCQADALAVVDAWT